MRILLVEDDPLIGSAVRDHIVAAGHAVDSAATLDEAAAHARVAEFGLMILDLAMPDGNGLAFLRALRAGRRAATPVIIVTARDQISDRIEGLNNGADDYLVIGVRSSASCRTHSRGRPPLRPAAEPRDPVRRACHRTGGAPRTPARPAISCSPRAASWRFSTGSASRPGRGLEGALEDALYVSAPGGLTTPSKSMSAGCASRSARDGHQHRARASTSYRLHAQEAEGGLRMRRRLIRGSPASRWSSGSHRSGLPKR